MRHTRRRQMFNRKQRESLGVYDRSYTIAYVRSKLPYTLDPTFKWHRVFNQVSYKEQYKGLESYVVIGLYSKRTSRLVNSK